MNLLFFFRATPRGFLTVLLTVLHNNNTILVDKIYIQVQVLQIYSDGFKIFTQKVWPSVGLFLVSRTCNGVVTIFVLRPLKSLSVLKLVRTETSFVTNL